ncbi:uncharacterized protein LOC133195157 [Saccostrea echinata]|uniref:uncharacterized protein LOC133195157 n=1 Tax=Saccostrea echinata TaxID=191078 RepID=UPI002A80A6C0|nr:uncharacterized protein LOC133195157 [Saccostrea echinata]
MPETYCIVPECKNKGDHILPSNKERRDAWIQAIRRGKTKYEKWEPPSKYVYICKNHFKEDDYVCLTYHGLKAERCILKKTAVPSQFAWSKSTEKRKARYIARSVKRLKFENETECSSTYSNSNDTLVELDNELSVGCQQEVLTTYENQKAEESVETSICVNHSSCTTQTEKCPMFNIEYFSNDNPGIHLYTGLEDITKFYFVLYTLGRVAFCLNYLYHQVISLDVPNQFFMVLIKLRRNTTNFELSRMFGVSEKVVQNIIITWINFMSRQWRQIDIWPAKELVHYFTPSGFMRSFPNTRVIIDGTECPIKKPKNPKAQQQTFSTYKNRNTAKVLVGATPGGLVSFVSSAYGGSASDRQITERSVLMDKCDPKDSIMADKGFNVQDLFAPRNISINVPTFFRKRNRLSNKTVLNDRRISSKRVHIERIIGLAKTYKILTEPMNATEANLSSDIIFICLMLCNFRTCIVPKHA